MAKKKATAKRKPKAAKKWRLAREAVDAFRDHLNAGQFDALEVSVGNPVTLTLVPAAGSVPSGAGTFTAALSE